MSKELYDYRQSEIECDLCGSHWDRDKMERGLCPECRERYHVEEHGGRHSPAGEGDMSKYTDTERAKQLAIIEMRQLANSNQDDPEAIHSQADRILTMLVRRLGCGEVADLFDSLEKWYA